jgi:DNA-binding MarR family transcriptional regulator
MELLQRNRSCEDERSVIVQLTEKGEKMQARALHIPEKLIKILLAENIQLAEVLQLKEVVNEWIRILSVNNKNLN